MQFASIIASRPSSSPTASARSRVPRRNRLLSGHMESASLQHLLPSSTHSRRTCSTFFSGAAAGATGAGGADVAQPPWVLRCATGGAPQPVLGGGAPQPPVLGGGAPQPPVASSGRERGGSRSRLLDRERDRRRLRDLSSRELPPYAEALRSMSSLDVSHASHALRQLSHGCVGAAQRSQMNPNQRLRLSLHAVKVQSGEHSQLAAVRHTRITGSFASTAKGEDKLARTRVAFIIRRSVTLPARLRSLLHAFLLQASKHKP